MGLPHGRDLRRPRITGAETMNIYYSTHDPVTGRVRDGSWDPQNPFGVATPSSATQLTGQAAHRPRRAAIPTDLSSIATTVPTQTTRSRPGRRRVTLDIDEWPTWRKVLRFIGLAIAVLSLGFLGVVIAALATTLTDPTDRFFVSLTCPAILGLAGAIPRPGPRSLSRPTRVSVGIVLGSCLAILPMLGTTGVTFFGSLAAIGTVAVVVLFGFSRRHP